MTTIWVTCQFSEKSALNATKLVTDAGPVEAGFVHLDGENIALTSADIATSWDANNEPKGPESHFLCSKPENDPCTFTRE